MASPTVRILVLIAASAVMCSCVGSDESEEEEIKLDSNDIGHLIELVEGQDVVVSLEGNPSTGFQWEVIALDEQVLANQSQAFETRSDLEGDPGLVVLRFRAVGTGETDLELAYRRPWEQDVEPLATYSLQVVVRQ